MELMDNCMTVVGVDVLQDRLRSWFMNGCELR